MRIGRLDLLRYGRFSDVSLGLPAHDPDIHILFGPNEAGKSTALTAVEDLLFGIPHNSPLNFLHEYASMRIGAVLENDDQALEFRRRKGKRDTLLTPEESPIPLGERALAPFLDGADRSFLARMFSLDHERLRQGGRDILDAQDEIGQMLFSAGAGLSGLRDTLKPLLMKRTGFGPRAGRRDENTSRLRTGYARRKPRSARIPSPLPSGRSSSGPTMPTRTPTPRSKPKSKRHPASSGSSVVFDESTEVFAARQNWTGRLQSWTKRQNFPRTPARFSRPRSVMTVLPRRALRR